MPALGCCESELFKELVISVMLQSSHCTYLIVIFHFFSITAIHVYFKQKCQILVVLIVQNGRVFLLSTSVLVCLSLQRVCNMFAIFSHLPVSGVQSHKGILKLFMGEGAKAVGVVEKNVLRYCEYYIFQNDVSSFYCLI